MDRDSVKGKTEKVVGSVKETTGRVIGNPDLEAEGVGDQAKGHIHDTVGAVKDAARDVVRGSRDTHKP